MSEISLERHVNELRTIPKEELLNVLESVDTKYLMHALWNKIERLENLEVDMKNLFTK